MAGPYITIIKSSSMEDLNLHTQVFNISNFSSTVCVKLPPDFPRDFDLVDIYNLEADKSIDFTDYVERVPYKPWLDFKSTILNTDIGQHTYRLDFYSKFTTLSASCWFSYIIQDNHPEQPYIYMDRDSSGGDDDSSSGSEE